MTLEIIVIFCINCPSFTFHSLVFHPSPCFSFSFEIIIEAKLIHHYVNGYSYKIDPHFECPLINFFFTFQLYF